MTRPTGRAAKRAATAERILTAARAEFGELGLEAATVRGIAGRAGVDPSLVIQHYGSKAELFALAIELRTGVPEGEAHAHLFDVLDARLQPPPPATMALLRSMLTSPEATQVMKAFLEERAGNLANGTEGPDAELRAALTVTSILGLTLTRHLLHLDGMQHISEDQLERVVRPWLTAALDGAQAARPD